MLSQRREFRLTLTNVDRNITIRRPVVLSRHPSETAEHLTLRMLTYCLLHEEGLTFGPGVCVGDAPDLETRDLTGRVSTWIACGNVSPKLARRALQHNREAAVHVVFGEQQRRDAFVGEVASWGTRPPRGWERLSIWTVDEGLIARLAVREALRQDWTVTVTGDHLYVEADGTPDEGAVTRG